MLDLSKKNDIKNEMDKLISKTRIISTIRFILFSIIVVFLVCFLSLNQFYLYLILSTITIFTLAVFIIFTNKYYHDIKILKNLEYIYLKHENRRLYNYQSFSPDGREYIDYADYKQLDLDLLGPKSLYQYLCSAKTKLGREKLAKQLTKPEKKEIKFTKLVSKLAESNESLNIEASISLISNEAKDCDNDELLSIIGKNIKISKLGITLMFISYFSFLVCLGLCIFFKIQLFYLSFFILINLFISKKFSKNEIFDINSTKYTNLLSGYETLVKDIINININDDYYIEIKEILKKELNSLIKIRKIFDMLSYRRNFILSIIGNGLIYLDYIIACMFNYSSKRLINISKSLDLISEIELILSLANIGIDNEIYCIPEKSSNFRINNGYHPLVKNCITNDFEFNNGIVLTGSNMSGKTTFMRMLGINQILANAGGLVCGSYFEYPNLEIVTSLRANDMLQEGISTFYAEINRMKKIISISEERKTLVLIDEIFKGTNAKDRVYASLEIIKKLNSLGVYFVISTHDFELCDASNILNYHFDENYIDNNISFEYKIKNGKCNKTNAIYLLKMAGVLK